MTLTFMYLLALALTLCLADVPGKVLAVGLFLLWLYPALLWIALPAAAGFFYHLYRTRI